MSFEASFYFSRQFPTNNDRQRRVKATTLVKADRGLLPNDEFFLWGLLALALDRPDGERRLLATPYWLLRRLGLDTGGRQYLALRASLERLAAVSYFNDGFYNPLKQTHERVSFHFLNLFLPPSLESRRPWDIRFDADFFEYCQAGSGKLLFDLDQFRGFDCATRRLFLKLHDRFWRSDRVTYDLRHLAVNGLGFSATLELKHLREKLLRCYGKLLEQHVIRLPDCVTDPRHLITKRSKGVYSIEFLKGPRFGEAHPLVDRPTRTPIEDMHMFEPLQSIGFDSATIRRLLTSGNQHMVERWVEHTLIAMETQPARASAHIGLVRQNGELALLRGVC